MTSPNKIGRANGDESFTFTVFGGRDRRRIPVVHMATRHATQTNNTRMKTNIKRNVNIATIIALFLIAMSTSPKAITQLIVFITLLTVVFGRDFLLKKQSILSRDEAVA